LAEFARLTIPYIDTDDDGVIDGTDIPERYTSALYFSASSTEWKDIEVSHRDLRANLLTADTNHFTPFRVTTSTLPFSSYLGVTSLMSSGPCNNVGGFSDFVAEQAAQVGVKAFLKWSLHMTRPQSWLLGFFTEMPVVGAPTSSSVRTMVLGGRQFSRVLHVATGEPFLVMMDIQPGDDMQEWYRGVHLDVYRDLGLLLGGIAYENSYILASATEAPRLDNACQTVMYYRLPVSLSRPGTYYLRGPATPWTGLRDEAVVHVYPSTSVSNHVVGDKDCFGLGGACPEGTRYVTDLGAVPPPGGADYRTSNDTAFTDRWVSGSTTYSHQLTLSDGETIKAARLDITIAGIADPDGGLKRHMT
jgi:hypothetical protein